jgi:hypothetical protein
MKWIKVSPIILLLIVPLMSYGQDISILRTSAKAVITQIQQVDFKNFTFNRIKGTEAIRFVDGRYVGADNLHYALRRIAYGDLTGDGIDEAVALLRGDVQLSHENPVTTASLDEVFIYTLRDGRPVLLTNFEGGKRGEYILSIESLGSNFRIENQQLIIDQAVLKDDCEHVPTHYYTIKYRLDKGRMIEVERSILKPIPDNMAETG